jgi:hypothetical protein
MLDFKQFFLNQKTQQQPKLYRMNYLTEFPHGLVAFDLFYTPQGGEEKRLEIKKNGFLGKLQEGRLRIKLLSFNPLVHPYTLGGRGEDGQWKIDFKSNTETLTVRGRGRANVYEAVFPIRVSEEKPFAGVPTTMYPQNGFRLLVLKNGGQIEIWSISVVSQMGCFFYWPQKNYDTQCYREKDGQIFAPDFQNKRWGHLRTALKKLFEETGRMISLQPRERYFPKRLVHGGPLPKNQARVEWYNVAEGLGAASFWHGDERIEARIYWREIAKRDNGPVRVHKGEVINFKRCTENKSMRHGSNYEYRLLGIKVK